MKEDDWMQVLKIGYNTPQDWQAMNISWQRLLRCWVRFEDRGTSVDYRLLLAEMWRSFLDQSGLCAGIIHTAFHPDHGPAPSVGAWVWRQYGVSPDLHLGSLSAEELNEVLEVLCHAPSGLLRGFSAFELQSTERAGSHRRMRKFVCRDGEIQVTDCDEEIPGND